MEQMKVNYYTVRDKVGATCIIHAPNPHILKVRDLGGQGLGRRNSGLEFGA